MRGFFVEFGEDDLRLTGDGEDGGTEAFEDLPGAAAPSSAVTSTDSALLRAKMLALGLSRSATSSQSTRRLRLLRELEGALPFPSLCAFPFSLLSSLLIRRVGNARTAH